jgi:hypothetical protein
MNLSYYDYLISEDFLSYYFCSVGPNGNIKKIIQLTLVNLPSNSYFNLSFGDLNEDGTINDLSTTNNNDAEKVLATVARAVIVFTKIYPKAVVYVQGSTISRTRRYQMAINKFWKEIDPIFMVFGFEKEGFEPFRSGKNYLAFAVKRKNSNFS